MSGPTRAGGVYIPPHRLAAARAEAEAAARAADAADEEAQRARQRFAWEALRKAINGLINKVNTINMVNIVTELFRQNLVRGRGLVCRAVLKAQMASPGFTHVYAALVAVLNTKLPELGELLLKRVIIGFRRAYKRNNKIVAVALAKFLGHLVNHRVAHELIALQVLTVLLEQPTDDSVEVAIGFVKEVGALLSELTPAGTSAVFDRFRAVLQEGAIDKRVQYMIEGLFAVRKARFVDHPTIPGDLDLVEAGDQITHDLSLDDDALAGEEELDVWRFDPDFDASETAWAAIRSEILGDDAAEGDGGGGGGGGDGGAAAGGDIAAGADAEALEAAMGDDDRDGGPLVVAAVAAAPPPAPAAGGAGGVGMSIVDMTETDVINLKKSIYLTIMNSLDFEECAHKLMRLNIPRGAEKELASMLVECCSQERTFLRYYALLGQRFCMVSSVYQDAFELVFAEQYATIHRLETNKLRNVAKFFAHLLHTDALPWTVLEYIRVTEKETTSASRIFIKVLTQELSEYLGLATLRDRLTDAVMQPSFAGLFPTGNPTDTKFAINFFTSIGLGALTEGMRAALKDMARQAALAAAAAPPPPPPPAAVAATAAAAAAAAAASRGGGRRRGRSSSSRSSSGSRSRSWSTSYYTYSGSSRSGSYSSYSRSPSPRHGGRRGGGRSPSSSRSRSPPRKRTSAAAPRQRSPSPPPRVAAGGAGGGRGRPARSRTPPPPRDGERARGGVAASRRSPSPARRPAARSPPRRRSVDRHGDRDAAARGAEGGTRRPVPRGAPAEEDDLMADERGRPDRGVEVARGDSGGRRSRSPVRQGSARGGWGEDRDRGDERWAGRERR
jgi:pre-mRNA-splicing factor CWC22